MVDDNLWPAQDYATTKNNNDDGEEMKMEMKMGNRDNRRWSPHPFMC